MAHKKMVPGTGGNHYIPYNERSGEKSTVYFTEDLSAEGLKKIFERVSGNIHGKIGVKLHTGEQHGPNIIPAPWVEELIHDKMPEANKSRLFFQKTANSLGKYDRFSSYIFHRLYFSRYHLKNVLK